MLLDFITPPCSVECSSKLSLFCSSSPLFFNSVALGPTHSPQHPTPTYFVPALRDYVSHRTNKLTNQLTPWSTVLPEKLTSSQLVNNFPAFYSKVHYRIHKIYKIVAFYILIFILLDSKLWMFYSYIYSFFCHMHAIKQQRPHELYTCQSWLKLKLRGFSPHANYTDRAAAAGRRS